MRRVKLIYQSIALRRWISLFILAGLFFIAPRPAAAHGYIVRSIPDNRAVVERSPARVQYWFSEELEPDFSSITVRDAAGAVLATGGVTDTNDTILETRLPTLLPDGAYRVELRIAFASDGHVIVETQVFFVGAVVGGVEGSAASDLPAPLEVFWRALLLGSMTLLLGVFTLYAWVLLPSWGTTLHQQGGLPPRVMRRLSGIIAVALGVALCAHGLALIQQTMVFFGADAGRVITEGLWNIVRTGTRFGDTWNGRLFLLILVGGTFVASHYYRARNPNTIRAFWSSNVWAMLLMFATLSISSHAAGSPLLPWIAIGADWLHAAAVGIWVGGLAALALVLPIALTPYEGDARRRVLLAALNRFSPLAAACLLVVIATGVYSAANWVTRPADATSSYGIALILKVTLILPLVGLAFVHHAALRPERYARWARILKPMGGFVRSLRLEMVTAMAVLAAVSVLTATPVPTPDLDAGVPPPTAALQIDDLFVHATVTPGGPGVNTVDIVVTRAGLAVDEMDLRTRLVFPEMDFRGAWHRAESVGDGLYVSANADIDRAGKWLLLVENASDGRGNFTERAVFGWTITDAASVSQRRDPTVINLLALACVVVAIGFIIAPTARRIARQFDFSPVTITVAAGSVAAAVIIVIVGAWLTNESAAQYAAEINPPPSIVNIVLPDDASVRRGRETLIASCPAWESAPDWVELLRRLPRTRDEDLYAMLEDGWRGLGACDAALEGAGRWDSVNYIRSFEAETERS